jgi:hypothetical protein
VPYREPQPDPGTLHKQMTERVGIAQSRYAAARRWVIKPSLVAGLRLLLVAGHASGTHRTAQAAAALIAALAVAGSGVGYTRLGTNSRSARTWSAWTRSWSIWPAARDTPWPRPLRRQPGTPAWR